MSEISFLNQHAIQRRDAENAEISAEKTKTRSTPSQLGIKFNLSHNAFSALPLRSLRLCVEGTVPHYRGPQ
jgi:hypothetical protein